MTDENTVDRRRAARDDLRDALRNELLGPAGGPDEVLPGRDRPTQRYLIGRLAPAGTAVSAEEDDGAADAGGDADDADSGSASPINMAMNPSSIGLSFVIGGGDHITATADWGSYRSETTEEIRGEKVVSVQSWHRTAHNCSYELPLAEGNGATELEPGVTFEWLISRRPDGRRAVSLFLVNRIVSGEPERPPDDEWLFQPLLSVRAPSGAPVFVPRELEDMGDLEAADWDRRSAELLFWNRPEYAVGHGCAADWTAAARRAPATNVRTNMLPDFEIPRVDPRESDAPGLDMRRLGGNGADGASAADLSTLLGPLVSDYGEWVQHLRDRIPSLDPRLRGQAEDHLQGCEDVLDRVREGIDLITGEGPDAELARQAFCFANRSMALQRERSVKSLARRRREPIPTDVAARWRPFQLAFVLLNLPAMADREHPDRRTADLLWFPTGGGKTEAYLGLTAFALAHRRLRPALEGHRNDAGVTVLMRYTLRLLTIQQFQRATTLICACEFLRVTEEAWGDQPFSIGLWVGRSATPNNYSEPNSQWGDGAKEALQKLADGKPVKTNSPVQLLSCPWCGHTLDYSDYTPLDDEERVVIRCRDDDCAFSPVNEYGIDGIPAYTFDQQIYRDVPSLVIATVDKFAQMAWNGRVQALFGRVHRFCPQHGFISSGEPHAGSHMGPPRSTVEDTLPLEPPDLIIQDELHLISGPLGTLVGLYESAIDLLSSSPDAEGARGLVPKVVASTATIRRAELQVGALFDRRLQVFPPPGLEASDSWFGEEVPVSDSPGRRFVGVFAPGKSVKTALVRVYAALLSRAKRIHSEDADVGDPYMTLVGYFNSLRELGGALRLVEDDIPGRIRVLNGRDKDAWPERILYESDELTSNKKADEVPEVLRRLELQFPEGRAPSGNYPIDTLLASNMISVGVDIDRLGLMVVNGQPKTSAEYIQATSRVGRQAPGLVVTVYNWTRPRDISHMERFHSYHETLYRFVEATSVTPFSSRARDKGLEGVLTSLVRLGDDRLTPEGNAGAIDAGSPWVKEVVDRLSERATSIVGSEAGDETRAELLNAIDRWTTAVSVDDGELRYSSRGLSIEKRAEKEWLLDSQEERERGGTFVAPGSLREVENEVPVNLIGDVGGGA